MFGDRPPPFLAPPALRDIPMCQVQLEAWDRVPFKLVLVIHEAWPVRRCPRPSCRGRARAWDSLWACFQCGAMGGPGAWVAAAYYDWGFDQVQDVLGPAPELKAANG